MDGCGSVQQCPPLMAPLASGVVHRTQQLVSFLQRRLPTGSVQGTHRVRLRTGTHKVNGSVAAGALQGTHQWVSCNSTIRNWCHCTEAPLSCYSLPALCGVQRVGALACASLW